MSTTIIDSTMIVEAIRRATVDLDLDQLTPTTPLREFGLDSMDMMGILLEIEEACGIQVPDELIMQLNDMGAFKMG